MRVHLKIRKIKRRHNQVQAIIITSTSMMKRNFRLSKNLKEVADLGEPITFPLEGSVFGALMLQWE